MNRNRLDIRDKMPSGMEEYLSQNGWHFNKKLCEWAISNMWKLNSDGKKEHISITPKEEIKQQFKNYGITVDNCVGYDVMFVYHMGKSDYLGSSIIDERCLLLYVKIILMILMDMMDYQWLDFTQIALERALQ